MYLKSLTLKGFKSFADRAHMTFEPGLTVIVGPNGSGKSNISDSILWVLGEQSAKQLRGQAMEDVIFSGSSARKPVGVAEVTLVLDNSDHMLPVDFDEVAITRRMYRSGESEYLINSSPCRLMDIQDILHDSGLGKDTHSIISQGKLDAILQSRPEERRALIEVLREAVRVEPDGLTAQIGEVVAVEVPACAVEQITLESLFDGLLTVEGDIVGVASVGQQQARALQVAQRLVEPFVVKMAV